ncbi:MAG TPA: hypothetical protein PLN56_09610 [Methanoregulaceae archaeon]|nr:hypothetical protein [Methanothrix sp.]HOK07773.1 hypothetical protein [Syntrophales bacterium]HOL44478.1 hypothetical protein [Methanothrix sp.]HON93781.1 hypothetical protein [Sedimentisphaerales bacterium]HPD11233.1 hypothetical protein [Methanoregulaceae archaeon]
MVDNDATKTVAEPVAMSGEYSTEPTKTDTTGENAKAHRPRPKEGSLLVRNVPVRVKMKFKAYCALRNVSQQDQVINLIERWVNQQEQEREKER